MIEDQRRIRTIGHTGAAPLVGPRDTRLLFSYQGAVILTRQSFRLDEETPTVTVQAAYSKHRRQDVLPLHPSLVAMLRPWLAAKPTWGRIWPGKWAEYKFAGKMMQVDLQAAGVDYIDAHGLYADFHALRHTFITNMMKSGVNPKTAQALARHSTIDLTMNVYTSLTVTDQAAALNTLPGVPGA